VKKIPATRDSHQFHPMPKLRAKIPFQRSFTEEQFQCLQLGLIPESMDERWFIFLEGDWLYFTRSWTGYCIFQVRVRTEMPYEVVEAWANRDRGQYRSQGTEEEIALLTMLIDKVASNELI
jgi:hypothetical protein